MRFTKYNNPNKRRTRKAKSYNDRCIEAGKALLTDRKNGYELPEGYYNDTYKLDSKERR